MNYDNILIDRRGFLTIVTINRPEAHNALNDQAQDELADVFDKFDVDDEQRVAIITGAGDKAFCAGHDLKQQASGGELKPLRRGFGGLAGRFDLTKPVIAAVNGAAVGGGFELAMACDLIVACERASFALPEPRVGLAALGGGIQRLPQQIGLKRAMGLLLTGRRVEAAEAFEIGLVNEVVAGDALHGAIRWAEQVLSCSPLAVRATKDATMRGLSTSIENGMIDQWAYHSMQTMLKSADAVEGPAAFVEKRAPIWRGM